VRAPDPSENPIEFAIYAVALWVGVCGLLGLLSGWPLLAREYRASNRPSGHTLHGQVSRVGIVPEHNITGMVISQDGLYLWTHWAFRVFRPALLIPWSHIRSLRERKFLWHKWYIIETERPIPIVISEKAYEAIRPHLPALLHTA
jgi:hypothetical protein